MREGAARSGRVDTLKPNKQCRGATRYSTSLLRGRDHPRKQAEARRCTRMSGPDPAAPNTSGEALSSRDRSRTRHTDPSVPGTW